MGTTFQEGHSPERPVTYEVILGDIFLQQGVMYTYSLVGRTPEPPKMLLFEEHLDVAVA